MERFIVDRIEENGVAICEKEDGSFVSFSLAELNIAIQEGDCILFDQGCFSLDEERKKIRKNEIEGLMEDLFEG